MKLFNQVILASALLVGASAFADHHDEMAGKTFEERKASMSKNADEHIAFLNEHKTCVTSAADDAALKACGEKMRAHHMDHKMDRMEKRKDKMEKKMDKMKDKMSK